MWTIYLKIYVSKTNLSLYLLTASTTLYCSRMQILIGRTLQR